MCKIVSRKSYSTGYLVIYHIFIYTLDYDVKITSESTIFLNRTYFIIANIGQQPTYPKIGHVTNTNFKTRGAD